MKKTISLLSFLQCLFFANAQFTAVVQPTTNSFNFAEVNESNNVALAGGIKLIKSVDSGISWTEVLLGAYAMPFTLYEWQGASIISSNEFFLIGKDDFNNKSCVVKTIDGGANWTMVLETTNGSYNFFTDIEFGNGTLIISSKGKVYVSDDLGITWSIKIMGNASCLANNINYNSSSGTWLTSLFTAGNFHKSTDAGITWVEHTFPQFNSTFIQKVNCTNNKFVITKQYATYANIYEVDANLNVVDTTTIPYALTFGVELEEADYLPNGAIIAYNIGTFIYVDPVTELHYFYDHQLTDNSGNPQQISDLDLGQTYGIAVGPYGAISRIDFSQPNELYVPSTFTSTFDGCVNGLITGTPLFNYANSYNWYLDGSLVSTNTLLSTNAPSIPGMHNLMLVTTYNGKNDTMSYDFNVDALIPPPIFSFNFDQTPCYNDNSYVQLVYQSGNTSSTTFTAYLGNQIIFGPVNVSTANIGFYTPIITQTDTLQFVFAKTQMCGVSYNTLESVIYVGDDLSDNFQVVPNIGLVCSGASPEFQVTGLTTGTTYTVECDYNFNFSQILSGNFNDTILVTGPLTLVSPMDEFTANFTISILSQDGCTLSDVQFDTVHFTSPLSAFETSSDSYFLNDTVIVLNQHVRDNRLWNVVPNDLNLTDISDTVPGIIGTNYGLHRINLKNEHFPTCIDSSYRHVRICDSLQDMAITNHWQINSLKKRGVIDVKFDQFGNIFELGVQKASNPSYNVSAALFLTKRSPEGNLIWTQNLVINTVNISGVVVEGIDFDADGNVFAALWIESSNPLTHGLINYTRISPWNERRCYIVKYSGLTGDMIWAKDLTTFPIGMASTSSQARYRTTDVKLSGDKVYFSICSAGSMIIGCMDTTGVYLSHDKLIVSPGSFPNNFYIYSGSMGSANETRLSPKLELLSTGELIVCGYFAGNLGIGNTHIPGMNSNGNRSLFVSKYTIADGLHDFKRIATFTQNSSTINFLDRPYYAVDANDNINFAINWTQEGVEMEGDTLVNESGSAVIQTDKNFNVNWISNGTNLEIQGLKVAKGTGDVYLLGKAPYNYSIGKDNEYLMIGEYGNPHYVDSFINLNATVMQNTLLRKDIFLTRMNSNGNPLDGKAFIQTDYVQINNSPNEIQSKIAVAPCGDFAIAINSRGISSANTPFESMGSSFIVDSSFLMKFGVNPNPINCSYLEDIKDSILYCEGDNFLSVQLGEFYNVDSIEYYLVNNGVPQSLITVPISDYLTIPLNNGLTEKLIMTSPIIDTVILIPTTISFNIQFDSMVCSGLPILFSATPTSNQYTWLNNTAVGSSYSVNAANYTEGLNELSVQIVSPVGCIIYDTLNYTIIAPDSPIISGYQSTLCYGDTILLTADPTSTNFSSPTVGNSTGSITLVPNNYNVGINQIFYNLNDTNGCVFQGSVSVNIIEPNHPDYTGWFSEICYGDENIIVGSPSYFNIYWPINGITSDTLFFNSSVYSAGPNNINYISTDLNGCNGYGTFYIVVHALPDPTFDSTYFVECGGELIIPFNSQDYSSVDWVINGVTQPNFFSELNLFNGTNTVEVTLETTNSCSLDTVVTIEYCYDLGLENLNIEEIKVFPNPSDGLFNVHSDGEDILSIKMIDQSGRVVMEQNAINQESIQIQTQYFEAGSYQLIINTLSKQHIQALFLY